MKEIFHSVMPCIVLIKMRNQYTGVNQKICRERFGKYVVKTHSSSANRIDWR